MSSKRNAVKSRNIWRANNNVGHPLLAVSNHRAIDGNFSFVYMLGQLSQHAALLRELKPDPNVIHERVKCHYECYTVKKS